MPGRFDIYPLGDHALTIDLGNTISPAVNEQCLEIADLLAGKNIPGVKDIIPAYCSVSVIYDPAFIFQMPNIGSPYRYMRKITEEAIGDYRPSTMKPGRSIEIAACFDEAFGPDLAAISVARQISTQEIIDIFIAGVYRVYMIGFIPGFPYMAKVDDRIAAPRKEKPQHRVEAGSIGIAGSQTGIYPLQSPGGWNIIGRTPLQLFDKDSAQPCLLSAGDEVRFRQIGIDEFHHLNQST